jgi:hypothetical protein
MNWFERLERRLGRFAVPQLTLALIIGQVIVYVMAWQQPEIEKRMEMRPGAVLDGEWWRILTFLVTPPFKNPICAAFWWYLFYLMGTTLEYQWGTFRYNLFLLIGYVASIGAAFAGYSIDRQFDSPASTAFWEGSVFLAFAYLYPDFVLYISFILPVKIKWLALLTWIWYASVIVFGPWSERLVVLASVSNFLLFFGRDLIRKVHYGRRQMAWQISSYRDRDKPFHRCMVCGITDKTHPLMDFRYCSQCDGTCGYCTEHLHNHEHVVAAGKNPTDKT